MRPIEETVRILENIELLLKSIDFQLTRLVKESASLQEKGEKASEARKKPGLLTTKEASKLFRLSEHELRRGYHSKSYLQYRTDR